MKKAPEDEMVQPPGAAETPWSTAARPAAGPSTATREGGLKWPLPFAVMACLVPLGYAAYTGHIWEDYFITFRYSQNLVEGQGLVYNPGERVHGFTSPLGVLLPALCYLITGRSSYLAALWLFRVLSIAAYVAGGLLVLRAARSGNRPPGVTAWALAAFYLFDPKAVAYTTNGMETGLLLFFLAWGIDLFAEGRPERWPARGVCWAGLLWTRPDGCVYIACLALAELIFRRGTGRAVAASLVKSGAAAAALYLPWLTGTWLYYGSPVPHTVVAKSALEVGPAARLLQTAENLTTLFPRRAAEVFQPIYYWGGWLDGGGWEWVLSRMTHFAGLFCAAYWLIPVPDRLGRMASFCFTLVCLYFSYLGHLFPWYFPPTALLGMVVLARGVPALAIAVKERLPDDPIYTLSRAPAWAVLLALAVGQIALFGLTAREMKIHQQVVEMGNRARLGRWLGEHVRPGERVYLEPLGYIGYFSGARMVDYPGLVSPEVVHLRREQRLDLFGLIPALRPDWVVLRAWEIHILPQTPIAEWFADNYVLAETFDVTRDLERYGFIPGKPYVLKDASFSVFRRKPGGTPTVRP